MKKTTDGRFIEKRVFLKKGKIKPIILKIKKNNNLTWKEFGKTLGVCSQMIRHDWLNEVSTIPLSVFKKLEKMYQKPINIKTKIIDPFWGQKLKEGKPKLKQVLLPNKNEKNLAEFYGILLGDGCIFSNMNGFGIAGDKILDKDYLENYIKKLIESLFGAKPSYYPSKKNRSENCFFYSRKIARYLSDLGFPKGKKCNEKNLVIPSFIEKNKENLASCLRGIMDTDGSLSSHPNSKIMIHLSITSPSLRKSVLNGLNKLGIKGGEFNKGIMLYGKDKIKTFYEKIGFSNKKNIIKYRIFIESGRVPNTREVESFIS